MRTTITAVLLQVFFSSLSLAGTVTRFMLTRTVPAGCVQPKQTWTFSPNDSNVYLWAAIKGAVKGESGRVVWINDDRGTEYYSEDLTAPASGDTCVVSALKVAGQAAATQTGQWLAKLYWGGSLHDSTRFAILAETQPDTGLGILQTSTGNCPVIKFLAAMRDPKGDPVFGMTERDFALKEDGVTQSATVIEASKTALSVALVVDISGTMSQAIGDVQAAAKALLDQLSLPADQVALYAVDPNNPLRQDFTGDRSALEAKINALSVATATPLYDTITLAANALAKRAGRKAIVVFTDGQDDGKEDPAIAAAKAASAPVFTMAFGDSRDPYYFAYFAARTGGFHNQGTTSADFANIAANLGKTFAALYEITYTTAKPAERHNVSITATAAGQACAPATATVEACSTGPGPDPTSAVVLTVAKAAAKPGDAVDVPVTIKSTNAAPSSFQMDLTYDPALLTYNSAAAGAQLSGAGKGLTCTAVPGATGTLRLVGAGLNQAAIPDGSVASVKFTLQPSFAPNTSTNLACSDPSSVDGAAKALPTTCVAGSVSATGCTCDLNASGAVDAADVQLMINQVLDLLASKCDLNGDGQTDVADLQTVINAALGRGCAQ